MNDDNIEPYSFDKLTASQQREIASMGGRASVEAKRERKLIAEYLEEFLTTPVTEDRIRAELERKGVKRKHRNYAAASAMAILRKVLKGDINAAKLALSLVGEMPKEETAVDMTVHEGNQVLALIPDDGRESNDDYKNPPATAADAVSEE